MSSAEEEDDTKQRRHLSDEAGDIYDWNATMNQVMAETEKQRIDFVTTINKQRKEMFKMSNTIAKMQVNLDDAEQRANTGPQRIRRLLQKLEYGFVWRQFRKEGVMP